MSHELMRKTIRANSGDITIKLVYDEFTRCYVYEATMKMQSGEAAIARSRHHYVQGCVVPSYETLEVDLLRNLGRFLVRERD